MKRIRLYHWDSIIDFGKYRGESIKAIFEKEDSYISWCFQQVEWFCITDEMFEQLPVVVIFRKQWKMGVHNELLNILIDKHENKKLLLEQVSTPSFDDYDFPTLDSYDKYGGTYDKYGGTYAQDIEGLSDEFIDDVLDGNPDAYWNID